MIYIFLPQKIRLSGRIWLGVADVLSGANSPSGKRLGTEASRFTDVVRTRHSLVNPATKNSPLWANLAGVAGFEPTHAGVKVPCLTAWLHPIGLYNYLLAGVLGFEPRNVGVRVPCLTAWRHPKETLRLG